MDIAFLTYTSAVVLLLGNIAQFLWRMLEKKPGTAWNGNERRAVENIAADIADQKVTLHAYNCPFAVALNNMRLELKQDIQSAQREMRESLHSLHEEMRERSQR